MNTVAQTLSLAMGHHRAGRLEMAATLYQQVLRLDPDNAEALHRIGVISHQVGSHDVAADLIREAIDVGGENADCHTDLGQALRAMGQVDEAADAFRAALVLDPEHPAATANLAAAVRDQDTETSNAVNMVGVAWARQGRMQHALKAFVQAATLNPTNPNSFYTVGKACEGLGQYDAAAEAFRRAVSLDPAADDAAVGLERMVKKMGRRDGAAAPHRGAADTDAAAALSHFLLGSGLLDQGRAAEALAPLQMAVSLRPSHAAAHAKLGAAYRDTGDDDSAVAACRRALELDAKIGDAYDTLGDILYRRAHVAEALACFRQAVAFAPDLASAHLNLGEILLLTGQLAEGFAEYEWRWRAPAFAASRREVAVPEWDGGHLRGRTLLLHADQGEAETLHALRYAPLAAARGGRVVVELPQRLCGLARASFPTVTIVAHDAETTPAADLHCPLTSLPFAFGTTAETVPAMVPYIKPDVSRVNLWRARRPGGGRFKVGLVWSTERMTVPLGCLKPLFDIPGVAVYGLQDGAAAGDVDEHGLGDRIIDIAGHLADREKAAAILADLDLVIAADGPLAHLAGAMGRPLWAILPALPDWRWMMGRDDSPWYPSARLFRLNTHGWADLGHRVVGAVGERMASVG